MKTNASTGQLAEFHALLEEKGVTPELFQERLRNGILADVFDPSAVFPGRDEWRKLLNLGSLEPAENISGYLKLISGAETLTLDSTDGTEVIAEAGSLFNGHLDGDFRNWKTNVKGNPTEAQNVQVHEMTKDGTFEQIYGGLGTDLNALCLNQAQIIGFVKKYRKWLREDGYGTSFLFKVGDEFFVAYVFVNSDGSLYAYVYRFSYDYVWHAEVRFRFVVPQQALTTA
jgi:hypothetical protein